jgi:hypothetical protein
MAGAFDPESLRAFRDRDWNAVREAKERFWAEDHRRRGPLAGLAVGSALWDRIRMIDPAWPDAEQRARDLAHHLDLAEKLRRIAHAFDRR